MLEGGREKERGREVGREREERAKIVFTSHREIIHAHKRWNVTHAAFSTQSAHGIIHEGL